MIANSTTLRLNFLLSQWWDSDMLSNPHIEVSYTFTIIGFIAESTLKFINDTSSFSVLTKENKKLLLELKESLLIMRDKPSLNRNVRSAPLYLFEKA